MRDVTKAESKEMEAKKDEFVQSYLAMTRDDQEKRRSQRNAKKWAEISITCQRDTLL